MRIVQNYLADLLNGEGLRNVYFFSGCNHFCRSCFNKETWDPDCEGSREWTEEDYQKLLEDANKSYISGITLTGGDPLSPWNEKDILDLCKRFKEDLPGKTIWCYTGFKFERLFMLPGYDPKRQILEYIDVLCDGPFIEELKSPQKPWVGSENQRVINVRESLKQNKIILV